MSKYQKLDSKHSRHDALTENENYNNEHIHNDNDDDDDEEESFSLYFDDKYKQNNSKTKNNINRNSKITDYNDNIGGANGNNNSNNNNKRLNIMSANQSQINYVDVNDGGGGGGVSGNHIIHDFEEHTMEVPLLRRESSSSNLHDYDTTMHYTDTAVDEYGNGGGANGSSCRCGQPGFGVNLKCKSAQEAKFKMLLAISLCCIFMIIEFLGGYIAGSLAIMTDAAHLASDCISFVIGLVAIWLGNRPPDERMSFGYKRLEVLGAVVSILGIWILTATLVLFAIQRIYSNDFDLDANTMMIISGIGILINIAMIFILHGSWFIQSTAGGHGHSHGHGQGHGHVHNSHVDEHSSTAIIMPNGNSNGNGQNGLKPNELQQEQHQQQQLLNGVHHNHSHSHSHSHSHKPGERNMNLRAAMIHVIGDLVQSIGVFLAAVLIKFCPSAKYADPLCTLLFSIIVIMTTVQLFRESLGILLDAVPRNISLNELAMDLSNIEGVKSVHHLNVWNHTSNHSVLMAHLVIDLLTDSNTVLNKATRLAASNKYNIKHATIQIERLPA